MRNPPVSVQKWSYVYPEEAHGKGKLAVKQSPAREGFWSLV